MIGDNIRETRKKNHLSLAELAVRVGVSESYISQLERNKCRPIYFCSSENFFRFECSNRHFF